MENNTNFQTFHQMGQAINDFVKQATGRDNVQNIDMDHITVAQNHFYQDVDVSGQVVSFHAGAAGLPLEKCVVQIEPVQDLHGYDHPWPAGGGKNLFDIATATIGRYIRDNGNTSSSANWSASDYITVLPETEYVLSGSGVPGSGTIACHAFYDSEKTFISYILATNTRFTTPANTAYVRLSLNTELPNTTQLELGSTATAYEPYSNICPITGWTGAQVFVSPTTDAADGQTYSITFPSEAGTVYGGTLDAVSGELVVDWVYNTFNGSENWFGESLANPQRGYYYTFLGDLGYVVDNAILCDKYRQVNISISNSAIGINVINSAARSRALLSFRPNQDGLPLDEFKVWLAENPISCAYKITSPATYQLTPTEITTMLGVNNIWSDAGDIEVKFKDLKELY